MRASLGQRFLDRRVQFALCVLFVVTASSYFLFFTKPDKDKLVERLNAQIKAGRFSEIYDDTSALLRLNVSREVFVFRMNRAVTKLRGLDPDLNLQRDREYEDSTQFIDKGTLLKAYHTLSKDNKSVLIAYLWTTQGELEDIYVVPSNEASNDYSVPGVSYSHLYMNGKLVE